MRVGIKLTIIFLLFLASLHYIDAAYKISVPKLKNVHYNQLTADVQKQIDCLAENIYHEARGEPSEGQVAVALVTLNRVNDRRFPDNICGVVKEKTRNKDRTVCQFSWYCMTVTLNRESESYAESVRNAIYVYLNYNHMEDITKGSLFYHADYVDKRLIGVRNLVETAKIGRHIFYNESELYATKTQPTTEGRSVKTRFLSFDGRNNNGFMQTSY